MASRPAPTASLLSSLSASLLVPLSLSLLALPALFRLHWLPLNVIPSSHALLHFDETLQGLLPTVGFAILTFFGTLVVVGACRETFQQRGFSGRDLLKPGSTHKVPESQGLPACCVYLLALFCFIPFRYYLGSEGKEQSPQTISDNGGWSGDMTGRQGFPHHELATYLSALLSLLSSLILGFCDDVFDIRWRFKMPIPIISSIPMLLVYYAGRGGTGLVVPGWPGWLRTAVGSRVVDLGLFYYVYMALLSVFCTHSINILAGINGVEVGQALIIAFSLCLNDALYLPFTSALLSKEKTSDIYWLSNVNPIQNELVGRHLFSLSLMLPLVGTCAGLLAWNRHPSLVFVGDTFCYFAGQALACAGVLGHFSKTLLLFFLPQVFNFLLSCPQLFGFVPCPRHRVPGVHRETMGLFPSVAVFSKKRRIGTLGTGMLLILEALRLVKLYREGEMQAFEARLAHKDTGDQHRREQERGQEQEQRRGRGLVKGEDSRRIVGTTNLTLLNSLLVLKGSRTPLEHVLNELRKADIASDPSSSSSTSQVLLLEIPSPSSAQPGPGPVPVPVSVSGAGAQYVHVHIDEPRLWRLAMGTQLLGSAIAFAVRYWAAAIVFPDQ